MFRDNAMGLLNIIWVWLKQLIALPANLAKVASINKYLELQQKLSETQSRLEETEKQLAKDAAIKAGRMFLFGNVYWAKDADGKIEKASYCPRCFELDGKAIHVITDYGSSAICPKCKTKIIIPNHPH